MKRLLLFLVALPLLATPPVVSNISFLYGSHSSVSVEFNISATANDFRIRYIPVSQGSCDSGNASATVESFSSMSPTALTIEVPVSGLASNTQYEFCPEVSNDGGSTWSTTGGSNPAGADFTTLPLPAIHPALPIHPATVDTSYPDTSLGTCGDSTASNYNKPGYCVKTVTVSGNSCTDLSSDMTTAIANQKLYGTIIEIPAGSVCEYFGNTAHSGDTRAWYQLSPDAIAYNPNNVSNNTIALTNHGLSEGQGVMFSGQEEVSGSYYIPDPPVGTASGHIYFVHVVDANDFQLYQNWQQETGSETSGSTSVVLDRLTGWADSPGISAGEEIVGSGISSGTTISSIDYATKTLTLSQAATSTASGVTFTFGGPLLDIGPCNTAAPYYETCSTNGGIAHFVPWPRQIPYWIIVRTSTPDSQFAPEGTRVNPSWGPKMATIEGVTGSNLPAIYPYVYSTHIRFVGIQWTWTPGTELSSDPAPGYTLITLGGDTSDMIFDRNWIHGTGTRNVRAYEVVNSFDGMDNAFINSYFDDLEYWHAAYSWPGINSNDSNTSSQTPTGTAGATSFTVPQTTVYYGAANPATLPATLTVSWTGTPSSSITTPEIAVYFDMQDNLQIVAPQGLAVTASAGTVSYTTASASENNPGAYAYCSEGDPLIPLDSAGHEAAAPLGCVRLNSSGQILSGGISAGHVYYGVETEGCQCLIGGYGPGPYDFSNNYLSGTGIPLHFDNGGFYWRGDYTIQRNTFYAPMTEMNDSRNPLAQAAGVPSDGYEYDQRQNLEFKGVQRAWIDGNIFNGFSDIDQGAPFIDPTYAGDSYGSRDVDVTNNTFAHAPEGGTLPEVSVYNPVATQPLTFTRFRLYNNLAWDINGYIYSSNSGATLGVGGWGQGGLCTSCGGPEEDIIIDHNTWYDSNGNEYGFLNFSNGEPQEGVSVTNNIIPYAYGAVGEDLFGQNYSANLTSACVGASKINESGTNCSIMAGVGNPDLVFKGNLIVPSWAGKTWPETNSGAQVTVASIQSDWPDYYAQNTIMTQAGVLNAFAAIGFQDTTVTHSWDANGNWTGSTPNFRLLSQSLYNFGHTTDGLQEGANINQLEAAQGKVTLVGANQITSTSANITYIAPDAAACYVDFGTDPTLISSFTRVSDGGGSRVRNVSLPGSGNAPLEAHTTYYYRVGCAVQQPTGSFATN